ncbi:hypothetical protein JS533_001910 [Bifidobacterium amazonense]|uniref:Uncharacterized protein n=1 Tax=Bifidobacterium amazonense TaxID=2809027 RepID=A0ABS9VSJ3_9BIFI|nr:hypothetical protein [Bifidobacterium amazonense]MCH9275038.1 hypothetical protein [Bifidobacterium amazonense]
MGKSKLLKATERMVVADFKTVAQAKAFDALNGTRRKDGALFAVPDLKKASGSTTGGKVKGGGGSTLGKILTAVQIAQTGIQVAQAVAESPQAQRLAAKGVDKAKDLWARHAAKRADDGTDSDDALQTEEGAPSIGGMMRSDAAAQDVDVRAEQAEAEEPMTARQFADLQRERDWADRVASKAREHLDRLNRRLNNASIIPDDGSEDAVPTVEAVAVHELPREREKPDVDLNVIVDSIEEDVR